MFPLRHIHRLTASSDAPYRETAWTNRRLGRVNDPRVVNSYQKDHTLNHSARTTRKAPETALTEQTGAYFPRLCQGACGKPIPAKRLLAQPNARLCVPCLVAKGDVAPIKRFDEVGRDGEIHQTFFTKDRRIERQINHLNKADVASADDFNTVGGDDEHLRPEASEIIAVGRSLSSVFEDELEHPGRQLSDSRIHIAARTSAAVLTGLKKAA